MKPPKAKVPFSIKLAAPCDQRIASHRTPETAIPSPTPTILFDSTRSSIVFINKMGFFIHRTPNLSLRLMPYALRRFVSTI